jgi:hypothetical protein
LGERLNGIQEVRGSTPLGSTTQIIENAQISFLISTSGQRQYAQRNHRGTTEGAFRGMSRYAPDCPKAVIEKLSRRSHAYEPLTAA